MSATNEKIIERVQNLLQLAEDNRDDEEGQTAFIMAQKLMIKYKISDLEIEENSETISEITTEKVTVYKRLYWWERNLADIIASNFRVKNYINSRYRPDEQTKRRIIFYGFGTDLELAKQMYVLAYDAVVVYAKRYVAQNREEGETSSGLKNSYIRGYLEGLRERFNDQIAELKGKYELIVQIPQQVEDAYEDFSSKFSTLVSSTPSIEVQEAYASGVNDGKRMDLTKRHLDAERF